LSELGLNDSDGALSIRIAGGAGETKRFEAVFEFGAEREIAVLGERIQFGKGANLRLFYSQRFTPDHLRARLEEAGLDLQEQWIAPEEGLFLCRRARRGQ
jgi:hypothetical protein